MESSMVLFRAETEGMGRRVVAFRPGIVDTGMQVTIRASGVNEISRIPRVKLLPATDPARFMWVRLNRRTARSARGAARKSRMAAEPRILTMKMSGPLATEWLRRSEEHTSELQSLMRISYAVFCLKKKNKASL